MTILCGEYDYNPHFIEREQREVKNLAQGHIASESQLRFEP